MKKIYYNNEGKELLARAEGLCLIALGGIGLATSLVPATKEISLLVNGLISSTTFVTGTVLFVEGAGDLVSGKHHYIGSRIYNHFVEKENRKWLF
jgi:hypothetical protein